MQQTQAAYLIIQLGNRWTDVLRLQPEQPVVVGRSSECQIVVNDDRVSRRHAEISPHNGGWAVQDLGSRNGTQVDQQVIEGRQMLSDGQSIEVGGCRMTFSIGLSRGFGRIPHSPSGPETQEVQPTIVGRLSNSQWSSEGIHFDLDKNRPNERTSTGSQTAVRDHYAPSSPRVGGDEWSFFYRLISELVTANSPQEAAQLALDRLLSQLHLTHGGVVQVDSTSSTAGSNDSSSSSGSSGSSQTEPSHTTPALSVLAAKQSQGGTYHRVSDFLVQTVVSDNKAVLARNVKDDSKLSLARASGQREVVSIICAPLRTRDESGSRVTGLLHIYSAGEERMLTEVDLEFAVGVADNLSIALSAQQQQEDLARSLETTRRRAEQLQEQLDESNVMVGNSESLQKVRTSIQRAGPTNATVLVRGESGVGKELVARGIHQASLRKDGPLVCLNCAALAPTLLESELFGHEKGSFTGATERKTGKFEAANGGTLLLDEIGEMPIDLQAKFLRVLEGQPFERLGGNRSIVTDVRVIAATNRDLEEAVKNKEFRSDLFFRLRVIEIFVPPLRDRKSDIPLLVEHFLQSLKHHAGRRITGVAPKALELLSRHHWPGNVRELRNVMERAIVLGGGSTIAPEDLSLVSLDGPAPSPTSETEFDPISLAELEKRHIFAMLDYANGNKTKASQMLGIERSTLDRKLKKY